MAESGLRVDAFTIGWRVADSCLTVDEDADTYRWRITSFFSKLRKESKFLIEGPTINIENDAFKLELDHFDIGLRGNSGNFELELYLIPVTDTIPMNDCGKKVTIEKINGSNFFESYAKKHLYYHKYVCKLPPVRDFLKFQKDLTAAETLTLIIEKNDKTLIKCPEDRKDLKDASSQTESLESVDTLSDNFKDLLASGDHSDVTIIAGNREFRAHKLVLAARSSVLNSMFSSDMIENNSGILKIPDCDGDIFQDFLIFLYSGKLDKIDSSKVVRLYAISDKYDLDALKKECLKRLMVNVSVDSVCDIMHVAVFYQETKLLDVATKFFVDNAEDVLATVKWKNFLKEHSEIGNELFMKYIQNIKEKK